MPYHALNDVKDLIRAGSWRLATQDCRDDVRALGFTAQQAVNLILRLGAHESGNSRPDCATDFGIFDADAYTLWCDTTSATKCRPQQGEKIYIKLAIRHDAQQGDDCLIVSFHKALR
jgi:hypothetical protein